MSERYTTDELQTQTERGDELAAQVEGLIMERDALAADNAALRAQLAGDVFVNVNGTEYRYYPGE